MAEQEVGNLAVRLSLDSANFEQSMASINRNLKALGQEMRGNQNLGRDWGNSITGLTTKQDSLTRMLNAQEIKVHRLREAYEQSKAETGENSAATENLATQLNRAAAEYNRTETELNAVREALRRQQDELRLSQSAWTQLGERMREVGATMQNVGKEMTKIGKEMSMKVTAPIVAMGTLAAKSAIDFESAFAGVRKTVDATEEEFSALSDGIRDMAKEIPAAATEIAGVAEAAGQLGIKKEAILGFTRTMVDLGVATNMSSEEAAMALARLANITKMNQQDFDRLGSAVVGLGNNFASTEGEIVEMALRLAGAGAQVGMSEADILGLSAALASVGIEAEMGGSAISKAIIRMQVASTSGFTGLQEVLNKTGLTVRELQMMASHSGKAFGNLAEDMGMTKKELTALLNAGVDLESFGKIAGMTAEEFKKAFEKDAVGALGAFINGLGSAEEAGESAINMLQEMGISEVRLRDSLLRAGNASELFAGAVDLSNESWEENVALTNEAEQRYATTASQLQIMVNYLKDLGITLGAIILPVINNLIEKLKPLIEKFANTSEATQKMILVIAGIAAAIGPVLVVIGALVSSVGAILTAFGTVSAAIAVLTTGVASAVPAVSALAAVFTVLTGPVGIAIAAIAGVAALGLLIYKNWEPIKTFFIDLWRTIADSGVAVWDSLKVVWESTVQVFKDLWSSVAGFFTDLWTTISTAAISIWDSVTEKWTAVVSFLTEIFSPMIGYFSELWTTIVTTATENFQILTDVLSTVWDNIKTIAEAAWTIIKNVILGPILLLINLVTGDFEEFGKNLSAIWTNISVAADEIWSTLKETVILVITTLIKVGLDLWSKFKTTFTNLTSSISETVSGIWERLKSSIAGILSSLVVSALKKWNELKSSLFTLVTNIVKDALKSWDDLKTSTLSKIQEVKDNIINPLKEIDLKQIGKDIIQGLIIGIMGKIEDVKNAIKNVTDAITGKIKEILQIKSPSRVMMKYGENTGEGLAVGIASTKSANEKAITGVAKVITDITRKKADEVTAISTKAEKDRAAIQKEYAAKRADLERSSAKSSAKIAKLNQDEQTKIAKINEKAKADIAKKEEKSAKDRAEAIKSFNKEMEAINEDYLAKVTKINDDLANSEKQLNDEYNKAYSDRVSTILNFSGIFDEFSSRFEGSGHTLIANLQSQVSALEDWKETMASLWGKIDDQALMEELEALGPNALGELQALNSLSESELSQYVSLYNQKFALAREQATHELSGMKEDTVMRIEEMRAAANDELDTLEIEWVLKIGSITKATDDKLKTLQTVGVNAGQGLLNGLASMEASLVAKATAIANAVKEAMASALEINSPSRATFRIGEWTGEGLEDGLESKMNAVANAGKRLAKAVIQPVGEYGVPSYAGTSGRGMKESNDSSRSYSGNTTINLYGSNFSPSEIARKQQQAQRQMALEWGY